jgi:Ca2+-binding RTX toxin-like protein
MATNYDVPVDKGAVAAGLAAMAIPPDIINKILKVVGPGDVDVGSFDSAPTGAGIRGNDLILINKGGTVDLSFISEKAIKGVDAFVFNTNEDVNFDLKGPNTKDFKGVITTGGGNDVIQTNSKKGATVSSGDGDDNVITGAGNDSVNLGTGNDTANTGKGNDTVSTGSGNDSVNTGAGNDKVFVGSGNDTVSTGVGNDTVKLDAGFIGNALLSGGGGNDKLDFSSVVINSVSNNGGVLTINLDNGVNPDSVVTVTDFEKFIYDSNGDAAGGVVTVGVNPFDAGF